MRLVLTFGKVFLFFPVLRRGSQPECTACSMDGFYSSPSCDGDLDRGVSRHNEVRFYSSPSCDGDQLFLAMFTIGAFLFFPVLRRGSQDQAGHRTDKGFLFFPVLRRGSILPTTQPHDRGFYSSPSCDGDPASWCRWSCAKVSILPRLATGIALAIALESEVKFLFFPVLRRGSLQRSSSSVIRSFYSSPSCDGDPAS